MFGLDDVVGSPEAMHVIEAHAVHDWDMREQICPLGQVGQEGMSVGHCTHRLNSVCRERSTPVEALVPGKGWFDGGSMIEDALALLTKTAMMEEVRIGGYRNGDSLSSTSPDGGRRLCDVFVASESSLCTTHQRDRTGQYNTARC